VKQAIALLLTLLFTCNLPAQGAQRPSSPSEATSKIRDQVRQLPVGAHVEIRFTDKTKSRGYLSTVEADGFSFKEGSPTSSAMRQVAFNDVKSVKVITKTHTPVAAWIALGAIAAAVIVVVAIFATERHNELGS
jgi:hypothetical protein